jgi:rifampicin phosphotransferase
VTAHDVAELRGIEVPDALVSALRSHLSQPPRELQRARVDRATEALRARVPEASRARFDDLLAEARLVHPLRDAHSVIDFWVLGLARRSVLEAGRRLRARGLLHDADHAVDLEHDELMALLRGRPGPGADEVAAHVRRRRSHTMEDAPDFLGFAPVPPPPPEWLPAPAARVARAMGIYIDSLFAAEARSRPGATLSGIGASAGTYEGTARLVLRPSDFDEVKRGDVLVARITTPSYNILLPMIGAVVTDRGGLLSHPAIVAREYGIPGVVSCREATQRIRDGVRVRVDGAAGTVTILE